ncbi:MAG TPA: hypothetical protein VFZ89_06410 [Solirubrobacteraceae bacterium]
MAITWSARPAKALAILLGAACAVAAVGIPLGLLIADDQAAVFREMMPGTWLSFAEFLAVAAAASATHHATASGQRWHETFWGLSAGIFTALAFVEIAQPTVFVAHWLRDHLHVVTPFGLSDLDAAILVGLLLVVATALAVRVRPLFSHPRALALLAIGTALGIASQGLDATFAATPWEFVAEESLKLAALPFMVAGFLVALRGVLRDRALDA